jgi:hypothetical protein
MNSGTLIDLDPPTARDRRWPFYVAWTMGGMVLGAALLGHLPGSVAHPTAPAVTKLPAAAPATPQVAPRLRVEPVPTAPARP